MTETFFPNSPNTYPATAPYVAQIPGRIRQGDSAVWNDVPFCDVNGTQYDSGSYTLRYTINGAIASALVLTAAANGSNWQTTLTTSQSGTLASVSPYSIFWWQAQVFATGVRVTIAEGELKVEPDLATQTNYDGRTVAEKALADAEAALATFQASGGRIQHYTIGSRTMSFQKDSDILSIVNYWRSRVRAEQSTAQGGADRLLLVRFNRAR